jgi:hypothetical protein
MERLNEYFYFKSSGGNTIQRYIVPQLRVNENQKRKVKIEIITATIYWTIPNIITGVNNVLTFSYNAVNYTINISQGIYDITSLNSFIKKWLTNAGIPSFSGNPLFSISGDQSTQKTIFTFGTTGVTINFSTSTIRAVLGFTVTNSIISTIIGQSIYSDVVANFNTINELVIHCNLCSGLYDDNLNLNRTAKSDILGIIQIDVPVGSQIIYKPYIPLPSYVISDNISDITLYITNELGENIIINDPWSVVIRVYDE